MKRAPVRCAPMAAVAEKLGLSTDALKGQLDTQRDLCDMAA